MSAMKTALFCPLLAHVALSKRDSHGADSKPLGLNRAVATYKLAPT